MFEKIEILVHPTKHFFNWQFFIVFCLSKVLSLLLSDITYEIQKDYILDY